MRWVRTLSFPLPVGEYEVKISATGFRDQRFNAVSLTLVRQFRLDGNLAVGSTTAGVHQLWIPLLDTESAKVDAVIAAQEIENLPLNGRNYLELALLTPATLLPRISTLPNRIPY
jgi:hypothetical protein